MSYKKFAAVTGEDRAGLQLTLGRAVLVLALLVSFIALVVTSSLTVLAQPVPKVYLEDVPGEVLIGEEFTFTVVFENLGSVGYGPFIDLVLQAGGADLNTAGGPCDGITFVSAQMVGVNPGPLALTAIPAPPPHTWSATGCQQSPVPGPIDYHPYPEVDLGIAVGGGQAMPVSTPFALGDQFMTIELPFGSFDPSQPAIVVEVTARVHEFADADPAIPTPLEIRARGGFRYGGDPLNIPVSDYPIVSHAGNSGSWPTAFVTPVVFTLKKEYLGPENEAVAGPNFIGYYPLKYRITVDVADLQEIKYLQVTDDLPGDLKYADNLKVWIDGVDVALSLYPAGTPVCANVSPNPPSFPVAFSEPSTSTPGGTLQVTTCQLITGHPQPPTAPYEVVIEFDFYIPVSVLNADCDPCPALLADDVKATGDYWTPLDPRDPVVSVVSNATPVDHTLQAKCMAIQKSVELPYALDVGEPGLTPGDTLKYTLAFQISDYHSIGGLEILDHLSDGQTLVNSPAAPELTIQDQFGSYTVGFPAGTWEKATNPGVDCTCCGCEAVGSVRGVTELVFDVSGALMAAPPSHPRHLAGILTGGYAAALPGSNTPAIGTLVFYAEVTDEFFVNTQSPGDKYVDKDDPINNCVEIRGDIYENDLDPNVVPQDGIGRAVDQSFTCVTIASEVLAKTVYAVWRDNVGMICGPGYGACGTPDVLPGDDVTFRIQYTIPSGDAEKLWIRDWLPLPVFDVSDPTNTTSGSPLVFSSSLPGSPLPPATGWAACGPFHSAFEVGLVTWFPVPLFSRDLPSNSFSLDYGTPWNFSNTARNIDLLFTLTVTNEPFADGLYLTNEAQECENNTFGVRFCQTAIAQVRVREPELSIKKGVIATDNPNGVFTPAPIAAGLLNGTPPGGPCPRFTAPVTSANLAGLVGRDLSNVDADDWVTFVIAIENTGGAQAYEIEVSDVFPVGTVSAPTCFMQNPSGLCVYDGYGASISYTLQAFSGGLISLTLDSPLEPLDSVTQYTGTNIAIITFDAQLIDKDHLQSGCCDNGATLIRYTSAADTGGHIHPNFVTAGFGGPFYASAQVCVGPKIDAKCVQVTSETHTTPPPPSVGPGGTVNAAIGEIIRFRLATFIPEGTTLKFQVRDMMPVGLTCIGNPSVTFVSDIPVTTTPSWPWQQMWGSQVGYGSCLGSIPFASPLPHVAVAPFISGEDPYFFVSSANSSTPTYDIHNNDNDPNLELVIVEINAQVDNILSNQNGVTLTNRFEVTYQDAQGSQIVIQSDPTYVRIVEPELTLMKSASPASTQPNGTVSYLVTATNTGTAAAFDVHFRDTLPTDLTLVTPSILVPWGCTYYTSSTAPYTIDVDCPYLNTQTSFIPIKYQATVASVVVPCPKTLTNAATVTWTSLPVDGTPPGPQNLTGQQTVGPSGAINGERNGSDGVPAPGVLNDYQATASETITVECCPCLQQLPPKMRAWWPLDETTGPTVHDIIGGHDGESWPGLISAGGPKSSVDWPFPAFVPKGKVDNALFFYGRKHVEVPHSSELAGYE